MLGSCRSSSHRLQELEDSSDEEITAKNDVCETQQTNLASLLSYSLTSKLVERLCSLAPSRGQNAQIISHS